MEKQTATEWLFERIWVTPKDRLDWNALLKQAIEMEKQQIIDAWIVSDNPLQRMEAEKYYNVTYKKD
jgi:hypothetical protein